MKFCPSGLAGEGLRPEARQRLGLILEDRDEI
jgi:hypothetical protein